jgi:thiosulfate/3-mercaptopyruvate sulfurtransferase
MPHSINVPAPSIIDPTTKTLLPEPQLRVLYEQAGIDLTRPIIHSCGNGFFIQLKMLS